MNAARRNNKRKSWPRGLYEPKPSFYIWRHPDGRTFSLGRIPLAAAINEAIAANRHIAEQVPSLVEKLTGATQTVADIVPKMPPGKAANTVKTLRSIDKIITAHMGTMQCMVIETRHCAELVERLVSDGKMRQAQAVRSRMVALFDRAQSLGWMHSNPAQPTSTPTPTIKRTRLTLESFKAIYAVADQVAEWLPQAMRLALVTGADRQTIAGLQRSNIADGMMTYKRGKTQAWIAVPLSLRLDVMGWTLAEVVNHRSGVISPYLVHHVRTYGNAPAGSPVFVDRISKAFTAAAELAGFADAAPTFHELRSLASRLYKAQGGVDVQALLGHADQKMTDKYQDPRGVEPVKVRVG